MFQGGQGQQEQFLIFINYKIYFLEVGEAKCTNLSHNNF